MCQYRAEKISGIQIRRYANDIVKEIFRKSIHLCTVFIPLLLEVAYTKVLVALAFVVVCYCITELLRIRGHRVPLITAITQAAARKRDENKFVLGPVTLALGVLVTALFFESTPAYIGICALALGDGLASLAGKMCGKVSIPFTNGKTAAGSVTCFAAIFISTFFITRDSELSLVIACAGMLIEILPLKDFDNLLIPVLLAALAQFLLS